jgi:hypothetical protein
MIKFRYWELLIANYATVSRCHCSRLIHSAYAVSLGENIEFVLTLTLSHDAETVSSPVISPARYN